MRCSNCGKENTPGTRFCVECGSVLPTETTQQNQQQQGAPGQPYTQPQGAPGQPYTQPQGAPGQPYTQPQGAPAQPNIYIQPQVNGVQNVPPGYEPISMWGYFGYELLFSIPCIGLIMLLIFSFGGTQNQNLKNFARSYFCFLIIAVVLILIIAAVSGFAFLSFMDDWF